MAKPKSGRQKATSFTSKDENLDVKDKKVEVKKKINVFGASSFKVKSECTHTFTDTVTGTVIKSGETTIVHCRNAKHRKLAINHFNEISKLAEPVGSLVVLDD